MSYTDLDFTVNSTNIETPMLNSDVVSSCFAPTMFATETGELPDEINDMVNRFCDAKRNEFARKLTIVNSPYAVNPVVVGVAVIVIISWTSPPAEFKPDFDDPNKNLKV
jgi:hypothetical protein